MVKTFPKKGGGGPRTPMGNGGARGSTPRGRGGRRISEGARERDQGVAKNDHSHVDYVDARLHIPKTADLKCKVRDSESSLCNKVATTSVGELTEFMIGELAYKRIFDTSLHSVLIEHVREFKKNFTDNIEGLKSLGDTIFPAFAPDRDIREQKLLEGNLYQFLTTVNNKLIPLWFLPHEKSDRRQALDSLAKAFSNWREGGPLVTKYAETPYCLVHLMSLKKHLSHFTPQEITHLLSGMATNLANFTVMLYVHILGLFVKFRVNAAGVIELYYRKSYKAAKEAGQKGFGNVSEDEHGPISPKKKKKLQPLEAMSEKDGNTPVKKQKSAIKRKRDSDTPAKESQEVEAPRKKAKKSDVITLSDDEDEPPAPPIFDIHRVKNEFNQNKVKKEQKTDNGGDNLPLGAEASTRLETLSRTSSNHGAIPPYFGGFLPMTAPAVTDTNDVYLEKMLKELEEDTTLSKNYKHMFSMLVANNRDLRQNNTNLTLMNRNQDQVIRQREARIQELEMCLMRFNAPFNPVLPPGYM